eukprot:5794183-Amphidinium_carterae.1
MFNELREHPCFFWLLISPATFPSSAGLAQCTSHTTIESKAFLVLGTLMQDQSDNTTHCYVQTSTRI